MCIERCGCLQLWQCAAAESLLHYCLACWLLACGAGFSIKAACRACALACMAPKVLQVCGCL